MLCWLAGIELGYVLLANGVLASGAVQKFVNDTESAHLEFDTAYTLIPALVHVEGLQLSYEDHNMQFAFDFEEGDLIVHLPWLVKKRFSASRVHVTGLRFLFRHKVTQVAGHEAALSWYPAIPHVSDPPLLSAPKPSNPDDLWSFELDGVDAHAHELWFMTYRYLGPARATGRFQLIPYENLEVGPAQLRLQSGSLHNGAVDLLAARLQGVIDLRLRPVNPETLTGMKAFEPISASVQLSMRLENLDPANLYLADPKTTRVMGGGGTLNVDVMLQQAKLTAGHVRYTMIEPLRVEREPIAVETAVTMDLRVIQNEITQSKRTDLSLGAERMVLATLSSPSSQPASLAVAQNVHGVVELRELDFRRAIEISRTFLEVPQISAEHLGRLDALIPGKRAWRLAGGKASVRGTFQSEQGLVQARLDGDFAGLQLRLNEHELRGFGSLSVSFGGDREQQSSQLDHAEILFNTLTTRSGDQRTADWWASVSTSHLQLTGPTGRELNGTIVVRAQSPEPVRQALGIPGIAKLVIPDKPLEVVVKLEQHGDRERLQLLHAKTGTLTVAGELWTGPKCSSGAFRVAGIAVPVGIQLHQEDSQLTWFASEDWLTEHIREIDCRSPAKGIAQRQSLR